MSSNNATATTGAINATATIQQQSRLKEIGVSSAQHQKTQSHNANLIRRAQRDSAASASSSSAVSSLWSQLLENVPQVRNATQFYVHDAMKGAKEAVGQLATNMQQHVSAQRQRSIDDANARSGNDHVGGALRSKVTSRSGDIGMSRFAFVVGDDDAHDNARGQHGNNRNNMGRRIDSDDFNPNAAFGDDNEDAAGSVNRNGSSASPPSAAKDGGGADTDDKKKKDGRTKAALAAASAASKATSVAAANIATGLYNILSSSSMVPEVHYNPGDAVYGSYPPSVAAYLRGGPSLAPASAGSGGDASPTVPPSVASALAPYIPPFGHCPPPAANDAYSTSDSTTPPSFTVLSAAVQNVLTHNNNNNNNGNASSGNPAAVTNYLSLALEDGIAIFEIDGSGVFEVVANIKGDPIMKGLYLQHSIGGKGRGASSSSAAGPSGAPPQPTPQRILDIKVLERHDEPSNAAAPIIGTINLGLDGDVGDSPTKNNSDEGEGSGAAAAKPRHAVTITSQSPIITYALLTDAFLHYEASTSSDDGKHSNSNSKTVCKRHQRVMVVECVPRCVLMGSDAASGSGAAVGLPHQVTAPSPSEFFVPLADDSPQQQVLRAQSEGLPFPPHITGKVRSATAGVLYRVVSAITLVNDVLLTNLSTIPQQQQPTATTMTMAHDQRQYASRTSTVGLLVATTGPAMAASSSPLSSGTTRSSANGGAAHAHESIAKEMLLLRYTIDGCGGSSNDEPKTGGGGGGGGGDNTSYSDVNAPTTMEILRRVHVSNGVHTASGQWLAYAGAPQPPAPRVTAGAAPALSQPLPLNEDPHTILRAEHSQTNKEYYAKAATSGWAKIGAYLGMGGNGGKDDNGGGKSSAAANDDVILASDGDFSRNGGDGSQRRSSPTDGPSSSCGVVTLCDTSLLFSNCCSNANTATGSLTTKATDAGGYHHDFASFAAHAHTLQCLAMDGSGTMMATASVKGTSVNVYQITRTRQRGGGGGGYGWESNTMARSGMRRVDGEEERSGASPQQASRFAAPPAMSTSASSGGDNTFKREGKGSGSGRLSVLFYDSSDSDDEDDDGSIREHRRTALKTMPLAPTNDEESSGSVFVAEVTLLYRLLRGTTSAVVTSISFSPLSLAVGVATSLGTCHFYAVDDSFPVARDSQEQLTSYYASLNANSNDATKDPRAIAATANSSKKATLSSTFDGVTKSNFNNVEDTAVTNAQYSATGGNVNLATNANGVPQQRGTTTPSLHPPLSTAMASPFACYRVGVRGELSALRRAPMVEPICRARSSVSTPSPWPMMTFRALPPYRLRAAVATVADRQEQINPNHRAHNSFGMGGTSAGGAGSEEGSALRSGASGGNTAATAGGMSQLQQGGQQHTATFDVIVFCPASLSVTLMQFNALGNAILLQTSSLTNFAGPRWLSALSSATTRCAAAVGPHRRHSSKKLLNASKKGPSASSPAFVVGELMDSAAISWLLQQERHCAQSMDYALSHTAGPHTHTLRRNGTIAGDEHHRRGAATSNSSSGGGIPLPPTTSVSYKCDVAKAPTSQKADLATTTNTSPPPPSLSTATRDRHYAILACDDGMEDVDAEAALALEEEEWDTANCNTASLSYKGGVPFDEADNDDFIVA